MKMTPHSLETNKNSTLYIIKLVHATLSDCNEDCCAGGLHAQICRGYQHVATRGFDITAVQVAMNRNFLDI
jgi:hypothetical protein